MRKNTIVAMHYITSKLEAINLFTEIGHNFVHRDANLLGGIPVSDRDGIVLLDGVKVHGYAVRDANLVRSAISPSDGTGGIPLNVVPLLNTLKQFARCLHKRLLILYKRQNCRLDRRNTGIKLEESSLLSTNLVLGIGRAN